MAEKKLIILVIYMISTLAKFNCTTSHPTHINGNTTTDIMIKRYWNKGGISTKCHHTSVISRIIYPEKLNTIIQSNLPSQELTNTNKVPSDIHKHWHKNDTSSNSEDTGNNNRSDFFWTWEAGVLVGIASASVVLMLLFCFLARTQLGSKLLQNLINKNKFNLQSHEQTSRVNGIQRKKSLLDNGGVEDIECTSLKLKINPEEGYEVETQISLESSDKDSSTTQSDRGSIDSQAGYNIWRQDSSKSQTSSMNKRVRHRKYSDSVTYKGHKPSLRTQKNLVNLQRSKSIDHTDITRHKKVHFSNENSSYKSRHRSSESHVHFNRRSSIENHVHFTRKNSAGDPVKLRRSFSDEPYTQFQQQISIEFQVDKNKLNSSDNSSQLGRKNSNGSHNQLSRKSSNDSHSQLSRKSSSESHSQYSRQSSAESQTHNTEICARDSLDSSYGSLDSHDGKETNGLSDPDHRTLKPSDCLGHLDPDHSEERKCRSLSLIQEAVEETAP